MSGPSARFRVLAAALYGVSIPAAGVAAASTTRDYGPGVGGTIPDNNTTGFLSPVVVEDSFPISSIEVEINGLRHNYSGDLIVVLLHSGVSPTTPLVWNLRNGEDADFDGDYVFSDAGADLWAEAQNWTGTEDLPPGVYKPSGPSNDPMSLDGRYVGEDAQGSWTLRIVDEDFLVEGSFEGWTLRLGGAPAEPCAGDLDGDGDVTVSDFFILAGNFGCTNDGP